MTDYAEADRSLMEWLKDRTDEQIQRLLDVEDGLDNVSWCTCLAGHAFGWELEDADREPWRDNAEARQATEILECYGMLSSSFDEDGTVLRRIQGFAAAELLTRRVERPKLMPGREVMTADPLNSGYSEEVG